MKAALHAAAGLAAIVIAATALQAQPRSARCVINSGGAPEYSGPCLFEAGPQGSFTVTPAEGRGFPGGIGAVSVAVLEPGIGDVRGLTRDGINSRWGRAARSRSDPACWMGEDFSICAY